MERDPFGHLNKDSNLILNSTLHRSVVKELLDWAGWVMTNICVYFDGTSGFVKAGNFLSCWMTSPRLCIMQFCISTRTACRCIPTMLLKEFSKFPNIKSFSSKLCSVYITDVHSLMVKRSSTNYEICASLIST